MAITSPIPTTNVTGQQTFNFPNAGQSFSYARITVERSGSGGTHPWLNDLTSTDTLAVAFQWSPDGQQWNDLGTDTLTGGSEVVKGVVVPQTNIISVGIGVTFPATTSFRVALTASTPVTFSGTAEYG